MKTQIRRRLHKPIQQPLWARHRPKKLTLLWRWFNLWRAFEALGIAVAIFAGWLAYSANTIAIDALQDQKIASAWQILAAPGRGSTGKRYALEVLLARTDEPLTGLDLGCAGEIKPVKPSNKPSKCTPADFSRATFFGAAEGYFEQRVIWSSNFEGVDFSESQIKNVSFTGTNLRDSIFNEVGMRDVIFDEETDLTGTTIYLAEPAPIEKPPWYDFWRSENYSEEVYGVFGESSKVTFSGVTLAESKIQLVGGKIQFYDTNLEAATIFGQADILAFVQVSLTDTNLSDFIFREGIFGFQSENDVKRWNNWWPNDISGTIFCDPSYEYDIGNYQCVEGFDQDFFDTAIFRLDNPPIGLGLLPGNFKIRTYCDFTKEAHREYNGTQLYREKCFNNPLIAISEISALREAMETYVPIVEDGGWGN